MATIKNLAEKTGLGLATISKYINGGNVREKNRIAIEAAIDELGFNANEFARSLRTNKSHIVGIIIPELNNLFITTIITIVEDILRKHGYGAIICDCRTDKTREKEAVEFLLNKRVDGIINVPVSENGSHLTSVIAMNLPVLLIDRMIPALSDRVGAVLIDNVKAAADAVGLLIAAGHSDIAVILGPKGVFTTSQRLLGYQQAFIQNNILPRDELIIYDSYTIQGGYEAMKQIMKEGSRRPSAVFVTNYEMTLGAVIAINELNIQIPRELSLIGFDNLHLSKVINPKLTVVSQPMEDIGKHAAEWLLQEMNNSSDKNSERVIILYAETVQGQSVASR